MSPETQLQSDHPAASKRRSQTATAGVTRIQALDFTKGTLVLLMVLYHWLNYFTNLQWSEYKYLHFLTPSFIFITGFMISNVYLSKYDPSDSRLSRRLFIRASKIMAVFLLLNAARAIVIPLSGTGAVVNNVLAAPQLFTIFVSGNLPVTGGKLVSFFILVPISYLLALCGTLMKLHGSFRYTFHCMCAILLLSIMILRLTGTESTNLELITIGLFGVLAGFVSIDAINGLVGHSIVLVAAYLCYVAAITIWDVPFPLLVIGVVLTLMLIYRVGYGVSGSGRVSNEVLLLGKYSLLGYIVQIAILQMLNVVFRHSVSGTVWLIVAFLAAFILTIAAVEMTDRARARIPSADKLYKAVFA